MWVLSLDGLLKHQKPFCIHGVEPTTYVARKFIFNREDVNSCNFRFELHLSVCLFLFPCNSSCTLVEFSKIVWRFLLFCVFPLCGRKWDVLIFYREEYVGIKESVLGWKLWIVFWPYKQLNCHELIVYFFQFWFSTFKLISNSYDNLAIMDAMM